MKLSSAALVAALLAGSTSAHSLMSMFWINDVSQGDGACIRMPKDGATSTAPIDNYLTTKDMACGKPSPFPLDPF